MFSFLVVCSGKDVKCPMSGALHFPRVVRLRSWIEFTVETRPLANGGHFLLVSLASRIEASTVFWTRLI